MSDVFISYARSTEVQAKQIAEALRGLGYGVWRDDELPAHRVYSEVIEERLNAAKAVVVIWSAEAVKSEWVRSEADRARADRKLVQLSLDGSALPMPFDQIQCADMTGWSGGAGSLGWRKVTASIADLVGGATVTPTPVAPPPPPLPTKPSIAVMPFANLSGDPEQDYFADGMVEELAGALAHFKSMFVIGGASGLSFKGKDVSSQEAARILGVRYVLEGSVRKAGGRVRIAVKLIDAADGAQIWANRFEDTLEDIFALQDRVALSVAGIIEPAVREAEIQRAAARPMEHLGSYDLRLRARGLYRTFAKDAVFSALDLLNRALVFDPDDGLTLAFAGVCHGVIIVHGWTDDPAGHTAAGSAMVQRALKVAGDDPQVLVDAASAMMMFSGGDPEAAAALADRAMELNPGSSIVWVSTAMVRLFSGNPQGAFEQFETALRLDPFSVYRPVILGMQGMTRLAQGRFREAILLSKQAAQLLPDWPNPFGAIAASQGNLGESDLAREAIQRFRTVTALDIREWAATWPVLDCRKLLVEGISRALG